MARSLIAAQAKAYSIRFGLPLQDRLRDLIARYPDVEAPSFLSWEGEYLTGLNTTQGLRNLLALLEG